MQTPSHHVLQNKLLTTRRRMDSIQADDCDVVNRKAAAKKGWFDFGSCCCMAATLRSFKSHVPQCGTYSYFSYSLTYVVSTYSYVYILHHSVVAKNHTLISNSFDSVGIAGFLLRAAWRFATTKYICDDWLWDSWVTLTLVVCSEAPADDDDNDSYQQLCIQSSRVRIIVNS